MSLLTIGYLEKDASSAIDAFLAAARTVLLDIRKRKQSRWRPQFNKSALAGRYGAQYAVCPDLGNLNYRPEDRYKGIALVNPDEGVRLVAHLLDSGVSVMLLCACRDYESCHRKTVYDLVMVSLADRAH